MSKKRICSITGILLILIAAFLIFIGGPKEYYGTRGQLSPGIAWSPERCIGISFTNPHKTVEGPTLMCLGVVRR